MSEGSIVFLALVGGLPTMFMVCATVMFCYAVKHQPDFLNEGAEDDEESDGSEDESVSRD